MSYIEFCYVWNGFPELWVTWNFPCNEISDKNVYILMTMLFALLAGPVVTDPDTHVGYYIKHRQDREDQVMDLLKTGPQSANSIVKVSCRLWNKTII